MAIRMIGKGVSLGDVLAAVGEAEATVQRAIAFGLRYAAASPPSESDLRDMRLIAISGVFERARRGAV